MLRRRFARSLDALEEVFAFVREFLAAEGLGEARAFTLDLVAEELFTNRVRHGGASAGALELALSRDGDTLTLVLRDEGTSYDVTQAPRPDLDAAPDRRRAGGLGVHLVRSLTRELRWQRDGDADVITAVLPPEG